MADKEIPEFDKMQGLGEYVLGIGNVVLAVEIAAKKLNMHPETIMRDAQACFELRGLKFIHPVRRGE